MTTPTLFPGRELRTQDGPSYAAMPGSMFGDSYHGTCPACAKGTP